MKMYAKDDQHAKKKNVDSKAQTILMMGVVEMSSMKIVVGPPGKCQKIKPARRKNKVQTKYTIPIDSRNCINCHVKTHVMRRSVATAD